MADVGCPSWETVTEGTITRWFKAVGDQVAMDEVLFEVSTDKVDSEVPRRRPATWPRSRARGRDRGRGHPPRRRPERRPAVGDGAAAPPPRRRRRRPRRPRPSPPRPPRSPPAAAAPEAAADALRRRPTAPVERAPEPTAPPSPAPAPPAEAPSGRRGGAVRPAQAALAAGAPPIEDHGPDPASIQGTGIGGRITRGDVEAVIDGQRGSTPAPPGGGRRRRTRTGGPPRHPCTGGARGTGVEPLNRIRLPHWRAHGPPRPPAPRPDRGRGRPEGVEGCAAHGAAFKEAEGFSPHLPPVHLRAVIDAIEDFLYLNAAVGDGELIIHGRRTWPTRGRPRLPGPAAPVVHDADTKRLRRWPARSTTAARPGRSSCRWTRSPTAPSPSPTPASTGR